MYTEFIKYLLDNLIIKNTFPSPPNSALQHAILSALSASISFNDLNSLKLFRNLIFLIIIIYISSVSHISNPTNDIAKNIVPNKNIIMTTKLNKHQHKCNIYLQQNFFFQTKINPAKAHNELAPINPAYIPVKAVVT